jgi:hypothetical protein
MVSFEKQIKLYDDEWQRTNTDMLGAEEEIATSVENLIQQRHSNTAHCHVSSVHEVGKEHTQHHGQLLTVGRGIDTNVVIGVKVQAQMGREGRCFWGFWGFVLL